MTESRRQLAFAPHVPPHRWAEVLDVLDQLIADEAFAPTKWRGVSAQGQLRSAMTTKEKRAAACRLLQEAVKHIDQEALPKAVAFASCALPSEKTMLLLSLLPGLDSDTQLSALHQILEQWPQVMDQIERRFGREDDRELIRRALGRTSPERRAWTIDTVLRRCTEAKEEERFYFADLMCVLVEFCSATQYMELAALGVEFRNVHYWARTAIELFGHGNAQQRADLLARCQPRRNPNHALITRVVAARHGSEPDRRDALRDIMSNRTSNEGWCLPYCVSALQLLEPPERYEHCARLLKEASGEGRRDTLERIRTLAPLIASFQTLAEVTSIIGAIEEVSEWWP